jgi:hypothetical protein
MKHKTYMTYKTYRTHPATVELGGKGEVGSAALQAGTPLKKGCKKPPQAPRRQILAARVELWVRGKVRFERYLALQWGVLR